MKKIIYFALLISFNFSISQVTTQLKVSESEEFKDEVTVGGVLAIHTTQNGKTGLVRASSSTFLLDVFDKDLKKISTQNIKSSKKESFNGFVSFENEIKYITVLAPSKRERIVYCNTFNIENNTHTQKELFQADVEKGGLFTGRNKRGTDVAISPNGKYIAIITDNIKKNLNSYNVRVFDSKTLDLLYQKAYQEDKVNYFKPIDLFIDDASNVFALGKLYKDGKKEKKGNTANYEFILNKISESDNQFIKIGLENENFISSLSINFYENKLSLLGFYSNTREGNIKGGCNFIINASTLEISGKKYTELPKDVYFDLYGDEKADRHNKKKKELNSFYVDYVIRDNMGNAFVLAEEFYVTQTYVSNGPNGGGYWSSTYHYDDILILKFDKEGEITWGRSIFKREFYPSYNAFLKDNKLHVILNSGKNLTEKSDGRTKVSQGFFESSSLYDFTFQPDGKVDYNKIQDNKGNTDYLPFYGTYNLGTFIMMSDGRRKKQFMKLQ